jgi:ribosome-associated heat shock protein Hsp15
MTGRPDEREDVGWQRLDKWLWCARFMRQRSDCAALVGQGGLRINRQSTEKPHARLRVGDVITLPLRGQVRVIEVLALAVRRGPASEAATLFRDIPPAPPLRCPAGETSLYPAPENDTANDTATAEPPGSRR